MSTRPFPHRPSKSEPALSQPTAKPEKVGMGLRLRFFLTFFQFGGGALV
jgi:hypothetical protein